MGLGAGAALTTFLTGLLDSKPTVTELTGTIAVSAHEVDIAPTPASCAQNPPIMLPTYAEWEPSARSSTAVYQRHKGADHAVRLEIRGKVDRILTNFSSNSDPEIRMSHSSRRSRTLLRPPALGRSLGVLATALLLACGDGPDDGAAQAAAAAPDAAPVQEAEATLQGPRVYHIGDVYDNGEFRATYLGMVQLPLGTGNVFDEGTCVTLLFEATFLGVGRDRFSPSVRGIFPEGREAGNDNTGVGCETRGVRDQGFEGAPRRRFEVDETARLFVGAIHIPDADAGQLQYVTLYGDDEIRMAVEYADEG